jgi:hypothetical protein
MRVSVLLTVGLIAAAGAGASAACAQDDAPVVPVTGGSQQRAIARGGVEIHADAPEVPVEAFCDMTFEVTAEGTVVVETIVADCTHEDYAEAAARAVATWAFEPTFVDGEPQARSEVVARVRFRQPG